MNRAVEIFAVSFFALFVPSIPANASIIVDFESDVRGRKPNGWKSDDSSLLSFTDSDWVSGGGGLVLLDYGEQSFGQGLASAGDGATDTSFLIMSFDRKVDYLHFWFGNDDPRLVENGDIALLTLFNEGILVGQTSVLLNGNDKMDQSIKFSGKFFDVAHFGFANASQEYINVAEIVDNIDYLGDPAVIPEPVSMAIWGVLSCFAAGGAYLRQRKRADDQHF